MIIACFFGRGGTDLCRLAGLLFLDGPTGADEAAGVSIGGCGVGTRGGGGGMAGACGGGDLADCGVGVHRGGDRAGGGDAALSCNKSLSSSCPTTL